VLPRRAADRRSLGRVRLVDLRGNVDSRLRRLREPRGSTRHLDGIVLAFAGLSRLWADAAGRVLLRELLSGLPRMVLPLSDCPAAPAQGALALECRPEDDAATAALLRAIDHAPTRAAVAVERALLANAAAAVISASAPRRSSCRASARCCTCAMAATPDAPLDAGCAAARSGRPRRRSSRRAGRSKPGTAAAPPARGLNRSRAGSCALRRAAQRRAAALFVSHRRALPEGDSPQINSAAHVWVPGIDTWQALAERGVWVEGCADGLGFGALEPMLSEPLLQLPARDQWTVLTHADAVEGWPARRCDRDLPPRAARGGRRAGAPPADATHVYWFSSAQFERWRGLLGPGVQHACGPGKTYEHLRRAGVQNLRVFPQPAHWRHWLGV
jgi:hypothetical protein